MPEPRFTLSENQPAVEIANVGLLDTDHQITLERAAERMPELQDEHGTPLTGPELHDAARAWAERIDGVEVADAEKPEENARPDATIADGAQPDVGAVTPAEQQPTTAPQSTTWPQPQPQPNPYIADERQ